MVARYIRRKNHWRHWLLVLMILSSANGVLSNHDGWAVTTRRVNPSMTPLPTINRLHKSPWTWQPIIHIHYENKVFIFSMQLIINISKYFDKIIKGMSKYELALRLRDNEVQGFGWVSSVGFWKSISLSGKTMFKKQYAIMHRYEMHSFVFICLYYLLPFLVNEYSYWLIPINNI